MSDMTETIDVRRTEPITDPAQGREAMIVELKRRWLGPLDGVAETLERSPVYAYLVGTLFPVEAGATTRLVDDPVEEQHVDEASSDWDDQSDEALDSGDHDDEDLGVNLTGAFGWAPASLGMSFVHGGSTIRVDLSAGVYEKSTGGDGERWVRRPVDDQAFIGVTSRGSVTVFEGRAKLSWRSRTFRGRWLTTVALSTTGVVPEGETKRHPELCLFQVEMSSTDETGIEPYPASGAHVSPDDKELAFRYRDTPSYAVGHGTAVEWTPKVRPTTITTHVIPDVEVQAIRAPAGTGAALRMGWLSDPSLPVEALVAGLAEVAESYRTWVEAQEAQLSDFAGEDATIAQTIVARQREALRRIDEGIAVLQEDDTVRTAFRLANTAMRWQMLRQRKLVDHDERHGVALNADRGADEPAWRPFQLGFILSALASTVDDAHDDRELVDLIWFPTGGGKTEAYLGLAAIEMIRRRLIHRHKGGGTAVLTRYTMRLLTAQQFQRAATLICALELMRNDLRELESLPAFSIGLWLGNTTTPGTYKQAERQLKDEKKKSRPENPFQLLECPWCGCAIMPNRQTSRERAYGVRASAHGFSFFCPDDDCPFSGELPVQVVDQGLYDNPPTMLVATVDKLARLAWMPDGGRMFGANTSVEPPSLVIQDELHLLSGPLGTVVGVYEAAIDALLRWRGRPPKVVASTATTRASTEQVRELMGRSVVAFPPAGLTAEDNHFSEPDPETPGRRYLGLMPQAHTPSWAVGQLATEMLNAPTALDLEGAAKDRYWTLAVYHNSLRELGRTVTILRDDVTTNLAQRAGEGQPTREIGAEGVEELNGNVPSDELASMLARLKLGPDDPRIVDALATTNIMSVGIDVERLGLMLVNGHTKTTAEYIQATSRVGRGRTPGLVVTMFRSGKPRDRSVFESFGAFHRAYYRYVEPSSVTPWSYQARRRALHAALIILVRHGVGLGANDEAAMFDPDSVGVRKAVDLLKRHISVADEREAVEVAAELDDAVLDWAVKRDRVADTGKTLLYASRNESERLMKQFTHDGEGWPVMNSMRNVDKVVKVRAIGERRG